MLLPQPAVKAGYREQMNEFTSTPTKTKTSTNSI